jgi:hypothetical protein
METMDEHTREIEQMIKFSEMSIVDIKGTRYYMDNIMDSLNGKNEYTLRDWLWYYTRLKRFAIADKISDLLDNGFDKNFKNG